MGVCVEELVSLRFDQIIKVDGVLVFDIQYDVVKNLNFVCKILLFDVILKLKFLDYVE